MNPSQRSVALASANAKRVAVAQMRQHVLAGRVGLADLFMDPPELLGHLALIDVMALARVNPRIGAWREDIGKAAVRAGVNVLMPLGKSSQFSRRWAARVCPQVSVLVAQRRREFEANARVSDDSVGVAA